MIFLILSVVFKIKNSKKESDREIKITVFQSGVSRIKNVGKYSQENRDPTTMEKTKRKNIG